MILGCEETRSAIVVDPGDDAEHILSLLAQHRLNTVYLLHTHAHIDHIGATDLLRSKTGAQTAVHQEDIFLVQNLGLQAEYFGWPDPAVPDIDLFLNGGETLSFGKKSTHVLHTPGHTPGSVTFHVPTLGLITGDTLFKGSIGRTDLWGGSYPTIIDSIRKTLFSFPDETIVYPGHGPATTIGQEKQRNPYVGSGVP